MFPNLIRKNFYKVYQTFKGYNALESLDNVRKIQWYSEDKLKKLQYTRLVKLLKNSYANVPYYKNLFNNIGIKVNNNISIDDFQKIPLLDKEMINSNKENLISSKYSKTELTKDTTSGSTGEKLVFYNDEKNGAKRNDYFGESVDLRNREWLGVEIWDKQVWLWGSQMDISRSKSFMIRMKNFIFPTLMLSSYTMFPETMKMYVKKINQYKPKVLVGYASSLYLFSSYLEKEKKSIKGLKGIISSAETLYEYQRDKIENIFGCKIFNRYGCREFGSIAQECDRHNGLHINDEHLFVEILDENGHPCDPGEKGQIVITNLDNYGFPFIRYKIGDIGTFSNNKCDCRRGLTLLEKIDGRTLDVIIGANGNQLVGFLWLVKGVKGIKQFQIIQRELGKLILKLIVEKSFTINEKQKLLNRVYYYCGKNMKVNIEVVDEIPLTVSGKQRFVISKLSPYQK